MRSQAASALMAVALLIAGCGGGAEGGSFTDKSGDDMARAAAQDMKDLHSLRVAGYLLSGGQRFRIDLSVSTQGDCSGTIGVLHASSDLVIVDGSMWIRPDAAFLDIASPGQGARLKRLIGDRWMVESGNPQLEHFCDLDNLLKSFRDIAAGQDPQVTVVGAGRVGSRDAVRLQGGDQGESFVVWVATAAPHYVLRMDMSEGSAPGRMAFTNFDLPLNVHPPAPSDVVNLSGAGQS